jgi:hypothetical protein
MNGECFQRALPLQDARDSHNNDFDKDGLFLIPVVGLHRNTPQTRNDALDDNLSCNSSDRSQFLSARPAIPNSLCW